MTYKRPFRRTILQSAVRFLSEARVFIVQLFLVSERDSAFCQVVGRHVHSYAVTGQDFDVVHPHLSRNVGRDDVPVFQFNSEHCVGQCFEDRAVLRYGRLFRHMI